MKFIFPIVVAFLGIYLLASNQSDHLAYYRVNIDDVGYANVQHVKGIKGLHWWVEAGETLLVLADDKFEKALPVRYKSEKLPLQPIEHNLYIIKKAHEKHLVSNNITTLVLAGRSAIVQTKNGRIPELEPIHKHTIDVTNELAHASIRVFRPYIVIARQLANMPTDTLTKTIDWHPLLPEALEQIDIDRWYRDVDYLASLNRYSFSNELITARDYLTRELRKLPGMDVRVAEFSIGTQKTYNVIATLAGTTRPEDIYIVGGHYDSISESPSVAAPGAEDNATGAAAVLEMARIASQNPPAATILFIAFGGEEQGLHGSQDHVSQLIKDELSPQIKGVITMDMIGYTQDGKLGCILETEPVAEPLMNLLAKAASDFTDLKIETTFDAWGSDHVPYLRENLPAVLTIDRDYPIYPAYHRSNDDIENISKDMAQHIIKMNMATLIQLAMDSSQ